LKTKSKGYNIKIPNIFTVVVVIVVDDAVRTKDVTKYALPVRPNCPETL